MTCAAQAAYPMAGADPRARAGRKSSPVGLDIAKAKRAKLLRAHQTLLSRAPLWTEHGGYIFVHYATKMVQQRPGVAGRVVGMPRKACTIRKHCPPPPAAGAQPHWPAAKDTPTEHLQKNRQSTHNEATKAVGDSLLPLGANVMCHTHFRVRDFRKWVHNCEPHQGIFHIGHDHGLQVARPLSEIDMQGRMLAHCILRHGRCTAMASIDPWVPNAEPHVTARALTTTAPACVSACKGTAPGCRLPMATTNRCETRTTQTRPTRACSDEHAAASKFPPKATNSSATTHRAMGWSPDQNEMNVQVALPLRAGSQ